MFTFLIAQARDQRLDDIFGVVTPPPALDTSVSQLVGFGLNIFMVGAGLVVLIFMLKGAFDYVTSGGDKTKIEKAQGTIISAVVGMILIVVVLSVWGFVVGDLLGIAKRCNGNWTLKIPSVRDGNLDPCPPTPPPWWGVPYP